MGEPLEEAYFNWLFAKVADIVPRVSSHWVLAQELHTTPFVWLIVGDDNRAMDGIELRDEFCHDANIEVDPHWYNLDCSVLEMLIAFSRRAAFETEISAREWFWIFMHNLGLHAVGAFAQNPDDIADILHIFMARDYHPNGSEGGLFPIKYPTRDQRKEELWHQFCDYLADLDQL